VRYIIEIFGGRVTNIVSGGMINNANDAIQQTTGKEATTNT
jgi:hypothetical protein